LAVGDFIITFGADNTILNFQPAAGVEAIILASSQSNANALPRWTDGTDVSSFSSGDAKAIVDYANIKQVVDNSTFFQVTALGAGIHAAFGAVQVV